MSGKNDKTLIEYFIPELGQRDGDYNVFAIKKSVDKIMLEDIIDCFPENGDFHFRFKFSLNKKNYWIDFNNKTKQVPQYEVGRIIIKASKLEVEGEEELEY